MARGFTLIELMIAMVIMLVFTMVTVEISANVFNSNTRSIQMIQLSNEMRSAIQVISRDIRRAGYNDDALAGLMATQAINSGVTMGAPDVNGIANCLRVQYDDLEGDQQQVVYRLRVVNLVGRVSAHYEADASCDTALDDDDWVDISDPLLTHVSALEFGLSSHLTDISENTSNGNMIRVGVEQISITISATLRNDATVVRSISNEVQIRNQYLTV